MSTTELHAALAEEITRSGAADRSASNQRLATIFTILFATTAVVLVSIIAVVTSLV